MNPVTPAVLVTGVSTGIGHAVAAAFLARGYRVFGGVRKAADGQALSEAGGPAFAPLLMDVTDDAAIRAGVAKVAAELKGQGLAALVNNAGIALPGPFSEQAEADLRRMFDVNVFGAMAVTRACLPLLGLQDQPKHAPGRVVNISSGAGQIAIPFLAGYVATKHALEGFSHALRRELIPWGIPVIVVGPGNVKTPIWDKAGEATAFDHTAYGPVYRNFIGYMTAGAAKAMEPEDIAAVVVRAVEAKTPRARYAPVAQKFANWTLPRLMPHKLLDAMMAKGMGMQSLRP